MATCRQGRKCTSLSSHSSIFAFGLPIISICEVISKGASIIFVCQKTVIMGGNTSQRCSLEGCRKAECILWGDTLGKEFGLRCTHSNHSIRGERIQKSCKNTCSGSIRPLFRFVYIIICIVPFSPHTYKTSLHQTNYVWIFLEDGFELSYMSLGNLPRGIPRSFFSRRSISKAQNSLIPSFTQHPHIVAD